MNSLKMLAVASVLSFAMAGAASAQAIAIDAARGQVMAAVPAGSQVVTSVVARPNGRPVYAFEIREPGDPITHMVYVDTQTGRIVTAAELGLPVSGIHNASTMTSKQRAKQMHDERELARCETKKPEHQAKCRQKHAIH